MAENRELALVLKLVADQFQSELKKSGGMLGEFTSFIANWKTQLVAAGGALFAIAKSTANYGEDLLKTSQKVGINVEALAGLQHAAKLADLDNAQLAQGLKFLSVNMVEAARQTGDGEALFRRVGIAATDATGQLRPTEAVLLDVAEAFANSKDGAGKAELAVKLFGKAGLDLIPFLNQGKAGIKELMAEAQRLGLVLSKEDAEAADRFNNELKKMSAAMQGVKVRLGIELLPAFTELFRVMKELLSGPGMALIKGEFQGLAAIFTLLSHGIRETSAEVQTFYEKLGKSEAVKKFYNDALVEGRKALDAETEHKLRMIFEMPGARPKATGEVFGPPAPKPEIAQLADQEKLGKALLEIFLEQQRAVEIRNQLAREGAAAEEAAYRHLMDFKDQEEKNEEERQAHLGRTIVEQTTLDVQIREAARAEEQHGLLENAQAWTAYYEQLGGDAQNFLAHKTELLRAQLANELDLTKAQSAELLQAWRDHDSARAEHLLADSPKSATQKETIELNVTRQDIQNLRAASDDFFAGWTEGMRKYVKDTQSGFGLAADMARRTAQLMETGFKNFFFDAMDHRIQSFKDVLRSLLGFAKQIIAQITAQLVTAQIVRFATSFGGVPTGIGTPSSGSSAIAEALGSNSGVRRFALGGSFVVGGSGGTDSVPVGFLATPGEEVSVRTPSQQRQSSAINIAITVNAASGERRESGTGSAPNFSQLARDLSRLVEAKLLDEQRPGGLLARGTA